MFLVLLYILVFILISEVLFKNHVCEKVSSLKITMTGTLLAFPYISDRAVNIVTFHIADLSPANDSCKIIKVTSVDGYIQFSHLALQIFM